MMRRSATWLVLFCQPVVDVSLMAPPRAAGTMLSTVVNDSSGLVGGNRCNAGSCLHAFWSLPRVLPGCDLRGYKPSWLGGRTRSACIPTRRFARPAGRSHWMFVSGP